MIREIENLNKQIDMLMTEKTKCDAQKEVWQSRLVESIKAYEKEYGVDLSGKDLNDIKKKVSAESSVVEAKTKEEFELSAKLVKLINEGDIKGAWKVLGVDLDEVNTSEEVENTPTPPISAGVQDGIQTVDEVDDADFFGNSLGGYEEEFHKESIPANNVSSEQNTGLAGHTEEVVSSKAYNPFMFEDDEDEFITPGVGSSTIMEDYEDDEDEFITPNTNSSTVIEDDDMEDDFGGFGSILKGSKFQA